MSKEVTVTEKQSNQEIIAPYGGQAQVPVKVGIFDPDLFLHMHKIAQIMAEMSILPDGLCKRKKEGSRNEMELLPMPAIVANCFMVVNQAYRWKMDPFAVAQSCSVVHGRLMYEGKLVAAALETNIATRLSYEWGTWNAITETVDTSKIGEGDYLGVIVSGTLPGEDEPKTIEGGVGSWKTSGDGSPWRIGNMRRQMRYRGAREWARAHAPATMLGVIAQDEIDDAADQARLARAIPVGSGARERLHIDKPAAGFSADRAAEVIEAGNAEKKMAETSLDRLMEGWSDRDRQTVLDEVEKKRREIAAAEEIKKNQTALDLDTKAKAEETEAKTEPEKKEPEKEAATEKAAETPADDAGMPGPTLSAYSKALSRTKLATKLPDLSKQFFEEAKTPIPKKETRAYEEMLSVYNLHLKRCKGEVQDLEFNQLLVEIIGEPVEQKAAT